ncbi:MAG: DNA polymerase IV [Burkholderiales bacterium]|nr:DNA polymerase IV [Burkholderiales bacterium]
MPLPTRPLDVMTGLFDAEPVRAQDAPRRRILHLDMDAFFAAVELLRRPELRGKPVVIGGSGDPTRRGVVSTATYEARAFGVRSGMPLRTAAKLCPACVFLPVDFAEYRRYSAIFKQAMRAVSPVLEDRGIDEAFLDITDVRGEPEEIAASLKERILAETGLTCSIGIAPNKLLAKMASELDKPDGLTVLGPGDLERRIWPLGVRKVPGIGPKTEARLAALGIRTIGELAAVPMERLQAAFGRAYGRFLHEASHGIDEEPLVTHWEPKQRSRETTFQEDVGDRSEIARTLAALAREVAAELAEEGCVARSVGIKVRFADFETHTREKKLAAPTAAEAEIRKAAFECLGRIRLDRRVRLLGVRAGDLSRIG